MKKYNPSVFISLSQNAPFSRRHQTKRVTLNLFQGDFFVYLPSAVAVRRHQTSVVILNLVQNLPVGSLVVSRPFVANNANVLTTQSVDPESSSG